MQDWLTGYERLPISGVIGGSWAYDGPDRVVLHTTEGGTIEGAVAAFTASGDIPDITADLGRARKAQHLPLSRSATAVRNLTGGVETNRIGACIQIEIIGHAANPPSTDAELRFLAGILLELQAAGVAFQLVGPSRGWHPYPPENGIRLDGREPWRMTSAEWLSFNGVCGHQHVPENVHGDPGAIDMARVFAFAHQIITPPVQEDDDMPKQQHYVKRANDPQVWRAAPGTIPDKVALFATDTFVCSIYGITILPVPAGAAVTIIDAAGTGRDVWPLDDAGAAAFGLPAPA